MSVRAISRPFRGIFGASCVGRLLAEPGFARREPRDQCRNSTGKEGAHGGTMGSPMLFGLMPAKGVN